MDLPRLYGEHTLKPRNSLIDNNITFNQLYDKIRMLDHFEYPYAYIKSKQLKYYFKNVKKFKKKLLCDVTIVKNN